MYSRIYTTKASKVKLDEFNAHISNLSQLYDLSFTSLNISYMMRKPEPLGTELIIQKQTDRGYSTKGKRK